MSEVTIALDAMSGDRGVDIVIPAAIGIIKKRKHVSLILVGDQEKLRSCLAKHKSAESERLRIQHASQIIAMDDLPTQALRFKKDSSMRVAINLVKSGEAQACVSAGNTGALMATAHFVLKTVSGISRPAIIREVPANNDSKRVRILDLGANVDSEPKQLEQFATMGSVLTAAVDQIEKPKVALLNIGEESFKGNEQVKKTDSLLSVNRSINYIGFVEGDDIFTGHADVIVCDGFVGNVALKAMEGLASFIKRIIEETFKANIFNKLAALGAIFALKSLKKRIDPSAYNGASFLGLRGIVIKSHGSANVKGFESAIEKAILEVRYNVPILIENQIGQLLDV